jgi:hypothetical protein
MTAIFRALAVLAACCLALGACQDKHDPIKPTVFAAHLQP